MGGWQAQGPGGLRFCLQQQMGPQTWGRGHQHGLGLSKTWLRGKRRPLGGAQASFLAPCLLSYGFSNTAPTAPRIKP